MSERCQFRYADGSYCYSAEVPCRFHTNVTAEKSDLAARVERVREWMRARLHILGDLSDPRSLGEKTICHMALKLLDDGTEVGS